MFLLLLEKLTESRETRSQGEDGGARTLVSIQVACAFESSLLVGSHIPIGHLLDPGLIPSVLLLLFDGCQSSL